MSADDKSPASLTETLQAEAEKRAVEAAIQAAAERAAQVGDDLLDGLERALFDRVGGAEAVLQREEHADPLERLRAQYAAPVAAPPARPSRAEAEAKARAELERLKAARKKGG